MRCLINTAARTMKGQHRFYHYHPVKTTKGQQTFYYYHSVRTTKGQYMMYHYHPSQDNKEKQTLPHYHHSQDKIHTKQRLWQQIMTHQHLIQGNKGATNNGVLPRQSSKRWGNKLCFIITFFKTRRTKSVSLDIPFKTTNEY